MKTILFFLLLGTALCGCKKEDAYPVTESTATAIQSFRLVTESGSSVISTSNIDSEKGTIAITAVEGTDLTHLFPSAVIPEGAMVQPAFGVYADFSKPVQYTVIAGNRKDQQVWTITVNR